MSSAIASDLIAIPVRPATSTMNAGPAALIRDVILGGQDGLVNVLGLALGMAVATGDAHVVLTAGLAALLAESIAMAGVAFTSSAAERQLGVVTRASLAADREVGRQIRSASRRSRLAAAGTESATVALVETEVEWEAASWSARLELERSLLSPVREIRPIRAAGVVGFSTAIGSAVPLLPFVLLPIGQAPLVALAMAAIVLGIAGLTRADLTGGSKWRATLEMVLIGLVSAFAGYLIGQLLRAPAA